MLDLQFTSRDLALESGKGLLSTDQLLFNNEQLIALSLSSLEARLRVMINASRLVCLCGGGGRTDSSWRDLFPQMSRFVKDCLVGCCVELAVEQAILLNVRTALDALEEFACERS